MKSFNEALAESKRMTLNAKSNEIEYQKVALLERIKQDWMIDGKLKDLNESRRKEVLNHLLLYWDAKTGINKAGIKYLQEGRMTVNESSTPSEIKLFACNEVKRNIGQFCFAFAQGRGKEVVKKLQENLRVLTGKSVRFNSLYENTLVIIQKKIADDNA